jgi:hypothetical protein
LFHLPSGSDPTTLDCPFCHRQIIGADHISAHLASSGHKRKVRKAETLPLNVPSFEQADPFNK